MVMRNGSSSTPLLSLLCLLQAWFLFSYILPFLTSFTTFPFSLPFSFCYGSRTVINITWNSYDIVLSSFISSLGWYVKRCSISLYSVQSFPTKHSASSFSSFHSPPFPFSFKRFYTTPLSFLQFAFCIHTPYAIHILRNRCLSNFHIHNPYCCNIGTSYYKLLSLWKFLF